MVLDISGPAINYIDFDIAHWTSSKFGHVKGKEKVLLNMPQARGMEFVIYALVDADHASDTITRRSRTDFIVYLNYSPIY